MKNLSKYIQIGDFESTIIMKSPTYGDYIMCKVCTVDYISALYDNELSDIIDFTEDLKDLLPSFKSKSIETKKLDDFQSLSKFDVYTAFREENINWFDPNYEKNNGVLKFLPVSYPKEKVRKMIEKLYKKYSL